MNFLKNRWETWPPRWRLISLAAVTALAAVAATVSLLAQFNVNAILYKGF